MGTDLPAGMPRITAATEARFFAPLRTRNSDPALKGDRMDRIDSLPMTTLRRLALLVPMLALLVACKSNGSNDEVLTEAERAELRRLVEENMSKLTGTMQLTESQKQNIEPYMKKATNQIFGVARAYHANPNSKALRRFQSETRKIGQELRTNLQPFMTNAQLNNFMAVLDRTIQSVQVAKIARGDDAAAAPDPK